jgi:hypothetical protein
MAPKNKLLMSAATRRRASKRMSWMPPSEAKTQRSSKSRHGLWTGAHPLRLWHADVRSDWFGEIELIEEPKRGVNPITLVPAASGRYRKMRSTEPSRIPFRHPTRFRRGSRFRPAAIATRQGAEDLEGGGGVHGNCTCGACGLNAGRLTDFGREAPRSLLY